MKKNRAANISAVMSILLGFRNNAVELMCMHLVLLIGEILQQSSNFAVSKDTPDLRERRSRLTASRVAV
jgi:hypothetical protein